MAIVRQTIGIIGAAISGPVFALHILTHPILRKLYRPIIFEQLSLPDDIKQATPRSNAKPVIHTAGAAVGIFPNGLFPLYELGLRERLDAISSNSTRLSVWRADLNGRHKFYNNISHAGWDADLQTCPRIVERRRLRDLLLERFSELGGEVIWDKKLKGIVSLDSGRVRIDFTDEETAEVDLLIGADGAWSVVRKYILQQKAAATAEQRWVPPFTGVAGIYGISSPHNVPSKSDPAKPAGALEVHLMLLDQGNIGALPLEDGKLAWTTHVPEKQAPERSTPITSETTGRAGIYEPKLVPGVYDAASTVEVLQRHENIWHPVFGSWKPVFEASERIIRSPLRQEAWTEMSSSGGTLR